MAVIINVDDIEEQIVSGNGAMGLINKDIFDSSSGQRLHCRFVKIAPGGSSKAHKHEWDQLNYVLKGKGILKTGNGEEKIVEAGMVIYISGNDMHWYENHETESFETLGVLGPMQVSR